MTIHAAVEAGDVVKVKEYLASDPPSICQKTKSGDEPLHLAAWQGKKKVVEVLLAAGANINAIGDSGRTPLYYAIENGHKSIAELLLKQGADPNIKKDSGLTPLYYAASTGDISLAKKMIKFGAIADLNSRIYLDGPAAILDEIHKDPKKIHPQEHDLPSLVYDSVQAGNEELALTFAKMGVDPNGKVSGGDSVFLAVIPYHFFELTNYLIESGADLKMHSTNDQSVLEYCQMYWPDDRVIKLVTQNMPS